LATVTGSVSVNPRIAVPRGGPTQKEVLLEPLTLSEIIEAQNGDELCEDFVARNVVAEDERGVLCRTSPLDGALQILLSSKLQQRCMSLFHLPRVAGHTGRSNLYDHMRRMVYWPRMSSYITH
jgi:Integrase zinc binding domain